MSVISGFVADLSAASQMLCGAIGSGQRATISQHNTPLITIAALHDKEQPIYCANHPVIS
jgi:hypothetical protein